MCYDLYFHEIGMTLLDRTFENQRKSYNILPGEPVIGWWRVSGSWQDTGHQYLGYIWFWDLTEKQFWTGLHKLGQRTTAGILQQAYIWIRTGKLYFKCVKWLNYVSVSEYTNNKYTPI